MALKHTGPQIDWEKIINSNKENNNEPINWYLDENTLEAYHDTQQQLAQATWCQYRKEIVRFGEWLNNLGLIEPTKKECDDYLIKRRDAVSPGAARCIRNIFRPFGDYLTAAKKTDTNAWALTDPVALRITPADSAQHRKMVHGLYSLRDVAEILLAISDGDTIKLMQLIR